MLTLKKIVITPLKHIDTKLSDNVIINRKSEVAFSIKFKNALQKCRPYTITAFKCSHRF